MVCDVFVQCPGNTIGHGTSSLQVALGTSGKGQVQTAFPERPRLAYNLHFSEHHHLRYCVSVTGWAPSPWIPPVAAQTQAYPHLSVAQDTVHKLQSSFDSHIL